MKPCDKIGILEKKKLMLLDRNNGCGMEGVEN